jgi:predicted  nucleic acid-binding Zn-ribbon protein
LEQYESDCEEKRLKITKLQLQKIRLEALVNDFQDRNEEYLKVIKSVGEEVLIVLPNVKMFLRYALLSITESIRNNPERLIDSSILISCFGNKPSYYV